MALITGNLLSPLGREAIEVGLFTAFLRRHEIKGGVEHYLRHAHVVKAEAEKMSFIE